MVALGDEGFGLQGDDGTYPYQFGEGLDFAANLKIRDLDFGTFHLYPSSWGTSYEWGNPWVQAHGAACAAAGKPCLFEECAYLFILSSFLLSLNPSLTYLSIYLPPQKTAWEEKKKEY